ncbi:hypothetical protein BH10PAT1_BH10PAT1_4320 [soil metagenome]
MKNGYTLIELLVVIAIMAVLFTIGFNNFQSYSRQQALLVVGRTIQTDLKTAQEYATAGNKPSGCSTLLNGYQFNVLTASSYEIDANCTGGIVIHIKQVTIPSDFTLVNPNPNPIVFKALAQGTNIAAGSTAIINLTQNSTSKANNLKVNPNGTVDITSGTPAPNPSPTPSWTFCVNEGSTCSFSGTKQVRYGSGTTFFIKSAKTSIACNNATFGDPTKGVSKHCDYQ